MAEPNIPPVPPQPPHIDIKPESLGIRGTRSEFVKDGMRAHWKIHLNVSRDANDPTTKRVLQWLSENPDMFASAKLGLDSAQTGKGITIYAGDRDSMLKIAEALETLEAKGELKLPRPGTEALHEDVPIGKTGKIVARFDVVETATDAEKRPYRFARFSKYGMTILYPNDEYGGLSKYRTQAAALDKALAAGNITQQQYDEGVKSNLKTEIHERLTKVFGTYYTGSDPKTQWIETAATTPPNYKEMALNPDNSIDKFKPPTYELPKPVAKIGATAPNAPGDLGILDTTVVGYKPTAIQQRHFNAAKILLSQADNIPVVDQTAVEKALGTIKSLETGKSVPPADIEHATNTLTKLQKATGIQADVAQDFKGSATAINESVARLAKPAPTLPAAPPPGGNSARNFMPSARMLAGMTPEEIAKNGYTSRASPQLLEEAAELRAKATRDALRRQQDIARRKVATAAAGTTPPAGENPAVPPEIKPVTTTAEKPAATPPAEPSELAKAREINASRALNVLSIYSNVATLRDPKAPVENQIVAAITTPGNVAGIVAPQSRLFGGANAVVMTPVTALHTYNDFKHGDYVGGTLGTVNTAASGIAAYGAVTGSQSALVTAGTRAVVPVAVVYGTYKNIQGAREIVRTYRDAQRLQNENLATFNQMGVPAESKAAVEQFNATYFTSQGVLKDGLSVLDIPSNQVLGSSLGQAINIANERERLTGKSPPITAADVKTPQDLERLEARLNNGRIHLQNDKTRAVNAAVVNNEIWNINSAPPTMVSKPLKKDLNDYQQRSELLAEISAQAGFHEAHLLSPKSVSEKLNAAAELLQKINEKDISLQGYNAGMGEFALFKERFAKIEEAKKQYRAATEKELPQLQAHIEQQRKTVNPEDKEFLGLHHELAVNLQGSNGYKHTEIPEVANYGAAEKRYKEAQAKLAAASPEDKTARTYEALLAEDAMLVAQTEARSAVLARADVAMKGLAQHNNTLIGQGYLDAGMNMPASHPAYAAVNEQRKAYEKSIGELNALTSAPPGDTPEAKLVRAQLETRIRIAALREQGKFLDTVQKNIPDLSAEMATQLPMKRQQVAELEKKALPDDKSFVDIYEKASVLTDKKLPQMEAYVDASKRYAEKENAFRNAKPADKDRAEYSMLVAKEQMLLAQVSAREASFQLAADAVKDTTKRNGDTGKSLLGMAGAVSAPPVMDEKGKKLQEGYNKAAANFADASALPFDNGDTPEAKFRLAELQLDAQLQMLEAERNLLDHTHSAFKQQLGTEREAKMPALKRQAEEYVANAANAATVQPLQQTIDEAKKLEGIRAGGVLVSGSAASIPASENAWLQRDGVAGIVLGALLHAENQKLQGQDPEKVFAESVPKSIAAYKESVSEDNTKMVAALLQQARKDSSLAPAFAKLEETLRTQMKAENYWKRDFDEELERRVKSEFRKAILEAPPGQSLAAALDSRSTSIQQAMDKQKAAVESFDTSIQAAEKFVKSNTEMLQPLANEIELSRKLEAARVSNRIPGSKDALREPYLMLQALQKDGVAGVVQQALQASQATAKQLGRDPNEDFKENLSNVIKTQRNFINEQNDRRIDEMIELARKDTTLAPQMQALEKAIRGKMKAEGFKGDQDAADQEVRVRMRKEFTPALLSGEPIEKALAVRITVLKSITKQSGAGQPDASSEIASLGTRMLVNGLQPSMLPEQLQSNQTPAPLAVPSIGRGPRTV